MPVMNTELNRLRDRKLKVLVLEEDWCGDAAHLTHWGSRPAAVKAARQAFGPMPAKDEPGYAAALGARQ